MSQGAEKIEFALMGSETSTGSARWVLPLAVP
jgi:hypothetical protein